MPYKSQTLDPVIVENSKKLEVPTFSKKDIEQIVKETSTRGIDVDKLNEINFVKVEGVAETADDLDPIINSGYLPEKLENTEEISKEQYEKILVLLKKAVKDGAIQSFDYICLLNSVYGFKNTKDELTLCACFGCSTSFGEETHSAAGSHYEIKLTAGDGDNKYYYYSMFKEL